MNNSLECLTRLCSILHSSLLWCAESWNWLNLHQFCEWLERPHECVESWNVSIFHEQTNKFMYKHSCLASNMDLRKCYRSNLPVLFACTKQICIKQKTFEKQKTKNKKQKQANKKQKQKTMLNLQRKHWKRVVHQRMSNKQKFQKRICPFFKPNRCQIKKQSFQREQKLFLNSETNNS